MTKLVLEFLQTVSLAMSTHHLGKFLARDENSLLLNFHF